LVLILCSTFIQKQQTGGFLLKLESWYYFLSRFASAERGYMISMLKIYFGENVNKNKRVIQTCDISTMLSCFGKARLFFPIFMIHLLSTLSIVLLPAYSS